MNIKQAKQEIANTLKAYLTRDELGNYLIPSVRQRPVLLMGPPGIGKTQIMEQIAAEEGVGLVAYTITHHTRQSAIGLPFIEKRTYGGEEFSVTEYTMSEILASVYQLMERTGIKEGILFLDEINCVSETLAPMMLQFLQCKTFGNQRLPEGWLIVAAGNPPEYNKSVRDFDVVTLDRVKRIDVAEDFAVWKEYAYRKGLHGAVISYLDIKKDNFYRVETTVDGLQFATARGWEDLSELILAYEKLGLRVDREVVGQYIQLPRIAKDFANYLELYYKYQKTYHVEDILSGAWQQITVLELREAPFDEKLSVMGLVLSRLAESARETRRQDALTTALHAALTDFKDKTGTGAEPQAVLAQLVWQRQTKLKQAREAGRLDKETRDLGQLEINALEDYRQRLQREDITAPEEAMDAVRAWFGGEVEKRKALGAETGAQFDNAFRFLEQTFGQGQELVIFVTEITAGHDTSWFVENFGCDAYFRHNKELLFDDTRRRIREEIAAAKAAEREGERHD
ncbi:MAG: AAA family ATPase [Oscillospiraceae bacterium]|nr:AAA family ATPase [Oscillospiraceae bacterium]